MYDPWGTPMIYGNGYYGYTKDRQSALYSHGRIGDSPWDSEWRHKSGPPVEFNLGNPAKSWYPPNPNDDIPLKS